MNILVDSFVINQKKIFSPKIDFEEIQELPILYSNQFDEYGLKSNLSKYKFQKSSLKSGNLILEKTLKNSPSFFDTGVKDISSDFSIHVSIGQLSGSATAGYGILLGDPLKGGAYGILISPQKKVYFYGRHKKSLITLRKWQTENSVKGMPYKNEVWFLKKGEKWFFYINEKLVFETFSRNIPSKELRIVLNSNMKLVVGELEIFGEKRNSTFDTLMISGNKYKLNENINTEFDEIAPIISVDGSELYFFRNNHPHNTGQESKQDAWHSLLVNNNWSQSNNFGSPINNKSDNFIISVAPDKNTMLVTGHYKDSLNTESDGISITRYRDGNWTIPKPLKINDWYNYSHYNGFQLASDNKTLLISADRSDSKGGTDLYHSQRVNDSVWSKPLSLGNVINTKGNEYTPFLASDGKTLYFASSGYHGYGSLDIFMSKKLNDWTHWSVPVNLGSKINSKEWDAYPSVSATGDKMYFTSYVEDGLDADIFAIQLEDKAIKPEPVLVVKGTVMNSLDSSFIGTNISIRDLKTNEELAIANSNNTNGEYTIVLPINHNYAFYAEEKGYYSIRQNVSLDTMHSYKEISQDLFLTPFKIGEKITLNNVFFTKGMSQLTLSSLSELNTLIDILKENQFMKIEIGGHTDNVGKAHLNIKLSNERALSIKKYLVLKGVDADRLKTKGYGGSLPVASNKYEYSRKKNWRGEFMILID